VAAEHGGKVAEADRRTIENAMADLREAAKGEDAAAIAAKASTLQQLSQKLAEAAYAQPGASSDTPSHAGGDDVVDAEFSEVDDNDAKKSG